MYIEVKQGPINILYLKDHNDTPLKADFLPRENANKLILEYAKNAKESNGGVEVRIVYSE